MKRWLRFATVLVSVLIPSRAIAEGDSADSWWDDRFARAGVGGAVQAVARANNGDVYVGGEIDSAGDRGVNYIARWDGLRWDDLDEGVLGKVTDIVIAGDDVYVAGNFDLAGIADGVEANHIAKWDAKARQWSALGSGLLLDDVGFAAIDLEPLPAGGLLACSEEGVWRWDGANWEILGDFGPCERVVNHGGVIATRFNRIFKFDGSEWQELASAAGKFGVEGHITGMVAGEDALYIAGRFDEIHVDAEDPNDPPMQIAADCVARLVGDQWSNVGAGLLEAAGIVEVNAIDFHGGELFAAGEWGIEIDAVARWDGAAWHRVNGVTGGPTNFDVGLEGIRAIHATDHGVLIGGRIDRVERRAGTLDNSFQYFHGVAMFEGDQWRATGNAPDGGVSAIAVDQADVSIGGYFPHIADGSPGPVAAFSDWRLVPAAHSLTSDPTAVLNALAYDPDGNLYAGGMFEPDQKNGLAVSDEHGWSAVGGGLGGDWVEVRALATAIDTVYIGGEFARAGGNVANNIAVWDGSALRSLTDERGTGVCGKVHAIAIVEDAVFVGGDFTRVGDCDNGVVANGIARWQGGEWSALFSPRARFAGVFNAAESGEPVAGRVNALIVQGHHLYVGGQFQSVDGGHDIIWKYNASRWNLESERWEAVGEGLAGEVFAFAVSRAGQLFAGGEAAGMRRVTGFTGGLARFDGVDWQPVGAGLGWDVDALAFGPDGALLVGGRFAFAGGDEHTPGSTPSSNFARWTGTGGATIGPLERIGPVEGDNDEHGSVLPGDRDVPMFRFAATAAPDESATLTQLRLQASGTADDAADVEGLEVWVDADQDGSVGPEDSPVGSGRFSGDDGVLDVMIDVTIPAGATVHFIVTYDISADAAPRSAVGGGAVGGLAPLLPGFVLLVLGAGVARRVRPRRWALVGLAVATLCVACRDGADNSADVVSAAPTFTITLTGLDVTSTDTGESTSADGLAIGGRTVSLAS